MGIVNTVKTMSQSSGPLITGFLAESGNFWVAFVVAGCLKVSYDLAMLTMFVGLRLEGDKGKGNEDGTPTQTNEEEQFALDVSSDESDIELESTVKNQNDSTNGHR